TPYLPDFSWDEPEMLDAQLEDALWWIERFDLDGLRVDAVPMMPRFVTRHLTARVHRRFEGLRTRQYLVGETFTDAFGYDVVRYYLGADGLDGQFDFPLMWATRAVLADEVEPMWTLADAWRESEAAWAGSAAVMANFVGNHDVPRFISAAAGQLGEWHDPWTDPLSPPEDDPVAYDRLVMAQTFALTMPGAAVLFQGDEYGEPGAYDPDNRHLMRFAEDRSAFEAEAARRIGLLGRARTCLPALRRGDLHLLREEAERLTYLRALDDGAPAAVVLSRDPAATRAEVPLPAAVRVDAEAFVDVFSGRRIP
ncbi:MAG: hypothetical protein KC620_26415, partial [Myxococcales bacterium]|nr:hypothetical protein [Myxococcales bacterium]